MRKEEIGHQQKKICMSGFTKNQNKFQQYAHMIKELGGYLDENLGNGINVLIVSNVASQKYHSAKDCQPVPSVVSIDWLVDSYKQKDKVFLPCTNYIVKDNFFGMRIGIFGFNQTDYETLCAIVKSGKGSTQRLESLDIEKVRGKFEVILVSKKDMNKINQDWENIAIPIVGPAWFNRCVQSKKPVFPQIYAINHQKRSIADSLVTLTFIEKRLNILFQKPISDQEYRFLEGTCIYVFNFEARFSQTIKDIINCCGGFYVEKFSRIVTHVIPCTYSESDYTQFTKSGDTIEIVKLKWLLDCEKSRKRLPEIDYQIGKTKYNLNQTTADQSPHKTTSNMIQENSNGLHSLSMYKRPSISFMTSSQTKPEKKPVQQKNQSTIFKGYFFFILPDQFKLLKSVSKNISLNGGKVLDSLTKSVKLIYVVMTDSFVNENLLQKYNKYVGVTSLVSPRWVNRCIHSKTLLDPEDRRFYIFKPFNVPTPFGRFLQCYDAQKQRIRELLEVIGTGRPIKIMQQITHAICEPGQYNKTVLYEQLKKENPKVLYVKILWIIKSIEQKEVLDENEFLLEPI